MKRSLAVDSLRGLIMIFMALDHASAFIARKHFTEIWGVDFEGYPDLVWWFTRFVSHLCAPGFFMLMGMSVILFVEKRKSQNWKDKNIRNYLLKRGAVILLIMMFFEFPAWLLGNSFSEVSDLNANFILPGAYESGFLFPTTVLYGLGVCLMISAFLWKLSGRQLLWISLVGFIISSSLINTLNPYDDFHPLLVLTLVPAMSNGVLVLYPIVPWLSVVCFGMFLSKYLILRPFKFEKQILRYSIALLFFFGLTRFVQGFNFQLNSYHDFISFFSLIKYPPSISFISITLGILLLLLYLAFKLASNRWINVLVVYGQTAMFFYIIHLYFYGLLGIAFPMGSSAIVLYAAWMIGLMPLYFLSRFYLQFKRKQKSDSIWRMI